MAELNLVTMLAPVAVLQILLAVYALWDLHGQTTTRYLSKLVWAVVIVVLGVIGPLIYILLGREQ